VFWAVFIYPTSVFWEPENANIWNIL